MASESREEVRYSTTLDSPLVSLLRSLYLHGVEHCALAIGKKYPIYSKDQIVSVLERGNEDKKVCDAMELLSSNAFSGALEKRLMEPLTPVLLVTKSGVEVVPAEKIPEPALDEEHPEPLAEPGSRTPSWWNAPLPLALCAGKTPALNPAAKKLLDGFVLPSFTRKKRCPSEFLLELYEKSERKSKKASRQYLFTEVESSVFLVQDVTEDLQSAEQMMWMASIGQAFISDLKCKGKSVRQVHSPDHLTEEEGGEHLACIWEEKLLGYVCIDDNPSE